MTKAELAALLQKTAAAAELKGWKSAASGTTPAQDEDRGEQNSSRNPSQSLRTETARGGQDVTRFLSDVTGVTAAREAAGRAAGMGASRAEQVLRAGEAGSPRGASREVPAPTSDTTPSRGSGPRGVLNFAAGPEREVADDEALEAAAAAAAAECAEAQAEEAHAPVH